MAEVFKTICQMGSTAYAICGMDVYVENGKIMKVKGMKEHPSNRGTLCAKGLAAVQFEYDPRRLKYPLKRVGERGEGKWERISWDEALDTTAAKLNEMKQIYGAEAVAYHRGQGPGWGSPKDYVWRFINSFGTPHYTSHSHLCHTPRAMAHTFTYGSPPLPDWENTRCMLLWGYNPIETTLCNHASRIIRAKERGAKMIVVDPRFTKTAAKADIWVQPRPGTDGALALGMMNVIIKENLWDKEFVKTSTSGFEELVKLVEDYPPKKVEEITWVPADTIREVARIYATVKPAAIHECNGLDQHTNTFQATRTICILPVITGNIDVPGSIVWDPDARYPGGRKTTDLRLRDFSPESLNRELARSVSTHPLYFKTNYCVSSEVVDSIETGKPYPIRAMIVQGGDPLNSLSNYNRTKAMLKKLDFLAVHDLFMTAVAEIADLVLPAATFLERTLLIRSTYESKSRIDEDYYTLQNKVVEPLGECKSDADFIFELGRRLGYENEFPLKSVEEAIDEELRPVGLTVEDLKKNPQGIALKYSPQELYGKWKENCSKLPTGKIEIYSKILEQAGYDTLPVYKEPGESHVSLPDSVKEYPMVAQATIKPGLFSHAQYRTLPWLKEIMPEPWVEINSEKAKELGIKEDDTVLVESRRGSIKVKAKITQGIDPRVVSVTHGWGQPYASGNNDNIITPDQECCPVSGATGNRSFLCRVSKA